MADDQKVDNNLLSAYTVETEEQPDGAHRQVIKVAEITGSASGTSAVDDSAFTVGTDEGTPAMGVASSDTVDSGDVGVLAMDTSRRLLTSLEVDNVGLATEAKQDTLIGHVDGVEGSLTNIEANTNTGAVTGNGTAATAQRVTIANNSTGILAGVTTVSSVTEVTDVALNSDVRQSTHDNLNANANMQQGDADVTSLNALYVRGASVGGLLVDLGSNNDVSVSSSALPTGAATETTLSAAEVHLGNIESGQLPDGHNVTVDNAAGASAVNIQDGGNSITVDGTVTANLGTIADVATETTLGQIDADTSSISTNAATTATNTTTIAGAVSGTEMQVDIVADGAGLATEATLTTIDADTSTLSGAVGTVGVTVPTTTMPSGVRDLAGQLEIPGGQDLGGGITLPFVSVLDAGFQQPDFSAAGEVYGLVASTDGLKANSTYIKLNSTKQVETAVLSTNTTLTAINTTYNNTTTTAVSASVSCDAYKYASLGFDITKASTPTDILFEVEVSLDGTNYQKHVNGPLGAWIYDDTAVGSGGIERCLTFPIAYQDIRVRVTCTGTTAVNTFTVANATIYLRN